MIKRGTLHFARLDKRRPVIVVSPNYRNDLASNIIVVPCSTRLRPAPTHVRLRRGEGGAPEACMALCEQIATIPTLDIERNALGAALSPQRLADIERAILRAIGIAIPQ